ncbi:MAG: ArsR family transcriptional regulator [Lachnospiraceae bacterium]
MRKDSFYERRIDMMYYLSKVRETHYSDLCERYGISRPTVKRDLDFLYDELAVPLERKRGNDGFVRIYGTWRASQQYLSRKQEEILKEVLYLVPQKYREVLHSIIEEFGSLSDGKN